MPVPRSLADELRARDDAELAALLRARPDLLVPVPVDLAQLAARATTRTSVARALEGLDQLHLQVLDAVVVLPDGCRHKDVARLLGLGTAQVRPPLARLAALAVVWGRDGELRPVRAVRELIGYPAGLGPGVEALLARSSPVRLTRLTADLGLPPEPDPGAAGAALADRLSDPADLLAEADPAAREVLERLTWGPPTGSVADAHRSTDVATARTPVEWLLARGLIIASDPGTVVLPREVALHLRGGVLHRDVTTTPPPLPTLRRATTHVDPAAGASASTLLRLVDDLCESWGVQPAAALRTGGLGVRELRRTAALLDLTEDVAALVCEVAWATGLVDLDGLVEPVWVPTAAYDVWRTKEPGERWLELALAWLDSWQVASLIGSRDPKGKAVAALSVDASRAEAPRLRRAALGAAAEVAPAAPVPSALLERLRWQAPRAGGALREHLLAPTLAEAELVGVVGLGGVSGPGALLLRGDVEAAAAAMTALLPEPLDHVLLQADLTAVAPGPLEPALARELALMADVESTGGATVYRFTDPSVRRALDAGRTAAELVDWLEAHSRTAVPQPLRYLVDDVSRRHGRIRVGTAASFVRSDDPAMLAELLADRRAAALRLRRLAPTVLASQADPGTVLERLRAIGLAPAPETADGEVVLARPDSRRALGQPRASRAYREPPAADGLLDAAIRALRAGDRARTAVRRPLPVTGEAPRLRADASPSETLAALREAVARGELLWIGYVDNHGAMTERVVEPLRLEGGHLTAFDHRHDEVRSFAVHRITAVASVER